MGRNHDKWLLKTAQTFEAASENPAFSEQWRREMTYMAGHFYGRYFAYILCTGGPVETASKQRILKSLKPYSAVTLAKLVRMEDRDIRVRI